MICISYLQDSCEILRRFLETDIAWLGIIFVGPRKKEVWDLDPIFYISKALFAKLWWVFRTEKTLWTNFMWYTYCKKVTPQMVEWRGGSIIWTNMLEYRDIFDQEIWWELKYGHSNVWFYNWT